MKQVDHTEADGRIFRVLVPDDYPEARYSEGIPVGPPDIDTALEEQGWPKEARVRLHNQLHSRALFTQRDVLRRPQELEAALKAALRTDIQTIQRIYTTVGG